MWLEEWQEVAAYSLGDANGDEDCQEGENWNPPLRDGHLASAKTSIGSQKQQAAIVENISWECSADFEPWGKYVVMMGSHEEV